LLLAAIISTTTIEQCIKAEEKKQHKKKKRETYSRAVPLWEQYPVDEQDRALMKEIDDVLSEPVKIKSLTPDEAFAANIYAGLARKAAEFDEQKKNLLK
jgi:hypothetical protein